MNNVVPGSVIGLFLSTVFSGVALADTFTHKIYDFRPNDSSGACFSDLRAVATSIAAASGVDVVATTCSVGAVNDARLDGVITYRADAPLQVTRYVELFRLGVEDAGLYATEEDCVADVGRQEALFQSETGLTPFTSFCSSRRYGTDASWRLQIEAVGATERAHHFSGVFVWGEPTVGYDAMIQEISANLSSRGLSVSNAAFVTSGIPRLTFGYYNSDKLYLHNDYNVRADSVETCGQYLVRAQAALGGLEQPPVGIYCDKSVGSSGVPLKIFSIGESLNAPSGYVQQLAPGVYPSFAACGADRDQQIANVTSGGHTVLEAFCGYDIEGGVVLNLLLAPLDHGRDS